MSEAWFRHPERVIALRVAAHNWLGTPFSPNGNTRGMGVSCQKLASALYRDAGWKEIEVPEVSMAHARFGKESILEPFMDKRRDFKRVGLKLDELQAGDLLGFRLGQCVHHCGVFLGNALFVHALDRAGTCVVWIGDAIWRERLRAVWRPMESDQSDRSDQ